jgi:hypothetical protein
MRSEQDARQEDSGSPGPLVAHPASAAGGSGSQKASTQEDAGHLGAPPDLPVEPLLGVVRPDLPPDLAREGTEGQQFALGGGQMLGRGWELGLERLDEAGNWAATWSASGWSKTVRSRVSTHGWAILGTLVARLRA